MKKSGLADSPFFSMPQKTKKGTTPPSNAVPAKKEKSKVEDHTGKAKATKQPSNRDTMTSRNHAITTFQNVESHITR